MSNILIKEVVEIIADDLDPNELDASLVKLDQYFYGPYALQSVPGNGTLILGTDCAVHTLLYARLNSTTSIFVIEEDGLKFGRFKTWLKRLNFQNIQVYPSVQSGLDAIASAALSISVIGVHEGYVNIDFLAKLEALNKLAYFFGEFDEQAINIIDLYQISRLKADKFHWHNLTVGLPMIGCRSSGPLVSVVVPAYGVENYLEQCLSGLSSQALEAFEVLVIDDGAKDRSGDIADEWASKDVRIRVIHQQNTGCAGARSNGLHQSAGVFVGFADGDDWIEPGMYQALLISALRYNSDIAQCGYKEFYQADGSFCEMPERFVFSHSDADGGGLVENPKMLLPTKPTIWRRIYRREFLDDNAIDFAKEFRRFDDLPFQFVSIGLAERISVVPGHYYSYRLQRPGQDVLVDDQRLHVHFPIFRYLRKFLQEHYTPILERQLKRVQIASHVWASSLIKTELQADYICAAGYDIFGESISLSAVDIFWLIRKNRIAVIFWLFKIYQKKSKGQAIWQDLQNYNG